MSLRSFLRDERGSSIVELGLLAPILVGLVYAIVDLGKGFNEKVRLEQVVQRTIEKAQQGVQADPQTGIFSTLKAEAAAEAKTDESNVVIKYWLECNGVSKFTTFAKMSDDYNQVCPGTETFARYLEVSLSRAYTPTFNMPWLNTNAQGKVIVKVRSGIRVQ